MKDRQSISSKRAPRHPTQILAKKYIDLQRLRDEVRRAEAASGMRVSNLKLMRAPTGRVNKLN